MKKIAVIILMAFFPATLLWAAGPWEKSGTFYFLAKDTREFFSVEGAGPNAFPGKYLAYDGIKFLVKGAPEWKDYGRLNIKGNNVFSMPIHSGVTVDEVHLLAGGSYSNSYKQDPLLKLYGDNYYYSVITVMFAYQNGTYKAMSVPVFWDWFHLGSREWSKDGAKIKGLGDNPVRKDCSLYHLSFFNPRPSEPLRAILVSDSWLENTPFSDVFAVTLKSQDAL